MQKKIDLFVEPTAFFQERVTQVMLRQKFETIEIAEYYIVDLLGRFMVAKNLFDQENENRDETHGTHKHGRDPLAIMLLKAQGRDMVMGERVKILKKLGDTSLYISGFFGDSLSRKIIDLDYYREMGAIAYKNLADAIRDDQFQELYGELYSKFGGFVDILNEVSQEVLGPGGNSNQDLLKLYDKYVRTGSEFAKKQLSEIGMPMPPIDPTISDKKKKN